MRVYDTDFNTNQLKAHNIYRYLHESTQPLELDPNLAADSQEWADHLVNCSRGRPTTAGECPTTFLLMHSEGSGVDYGESLEYNPNIMKLLGSWATDTWYSEIDNYDWNDPGYSSLTENFT